LLAWTKQQARALAQLLSLPVFFGMRNWHPFIAETMEQVREAGVERMAAICLTPQFSEVSVGLYMKRTEEARQWAAMDTEIVWAQSFHQEPLLIEAFAERLAPLLRQAPGLPKILFTAHSLPVKAVANGDPYDNEARATAAAVARRVGLHDWGFAYQSQGMTGEQWLGPTVEACLDRYASEGVKEVIVDPIGFVCDHVEVLYDIDILFKGYAGARHRPQAARVFKRIARFYPRPSRGSNQVSGLKWGQGVCSVGPALSPANSPQLSLESRP